MAVDEIKVYLPLGCTSIHSWKVNSGSSIKKGETIALGLLSSGKASIDLRLTPRENQESDKKASNNVNNGPKLLGTILSTTKRIGDSQKGDNAIKNIMNKNQTENLSNGAAEDGSVVSNTKKANTTSAGNSARSRMLARARAAAQKQAALVSSTTIPPNTIKIISPADGFVQIIDPNPNKIENGKVIIAIVGSCTHPTIIGNLCAVCGMSVVDETVDDDTSLQTSNYIRPRKRPSPFPRKPALETEKITVSGGITVHVTKSEANSIGRADQNRLRNLRKLSLVLDLDHTLVHATADKRGGIESRARKDVRTIMLPMEVAVRGGNTSQQSNQKQHVVQTINMKHYIKLRPYLKDFILGVQDLYELSIYTAGTREYAEEVANSIARHVVGQHYEEEDIFMMKEELKRAEADLQKSKDIASRIEEQKSVNEEDYSNEVKQITKKSKEGVMPILKKNIDKSSLGKSSIVSDVKDSNQANRNKESHDEKIKEQNQQKSETSWMKNGTDCNSTNDSSSDQNDNSEQTESSDTSLEIPETSTPSIPIAIEAEKCIDNDHASKHKLDTLTNDPIPKKKRRVAFTTLPPKEHLIPSSQPNLHDDSQFLEYIQGLRKTVQEASILESKVIEVRSKLFGDRIVSRTDVGDLGRDVKSLKRVFPCGGAMAAIVDDREDVWANATDNPTAGRQGEPPANLLLVKPYRWERFSGYEDVNNAAGVDLTSKQQSQKDRDTNKDENSTDEGDVQLLWTLDILNRLHAKFYSKDVSLIKQNTLTVPLALKQMRRQVLGGQDDRMRLTNIVFSGLVPLIQQTRIDNKRGPRPLVERYAEELGATVLHDITKSTTHVVAARDGTEKVLRGREIPGCTIVEASWLMECYWSMTRREEDSHKVKPVSRKSILLEDKKKQLEGKRILLSGSDDSESDEDDYDWMEDVETVSVEDSK